MSRWKKYLFPIAEFIVSHDYRRKRKVKRYLRNHQSVRLHLGSGVHILSGWLNTDKSISRCMAGAVYMDVGEIFLPCQFMS